MSTSGVLEHTVNPFNGITIERNLLPSDADVFRDQLARSLAEWRKNGNLLVWLEVPIEKSELVPVGVEEGFDFHHSGEGYLMMTLRLVENALIPGYATHYIGAGGVVINDKNEILVVVERHRRSKHPSYKLPGGALQSGEHLEDCVVREISEETGIETIFESLVCFRHWHGYRYEKSDIYFVCRLRPRSREITIQDDEIESCQWMPVDEYLASEFVHSFNRRIVQVALNGSGVVPTEIDGYTDPKKHEVFMPEGIQFDI